MFWEKGVVASLPSHCEGRSGSLMSGRACHAQLYTGLFLLCPVLFLGMAVKVGWTNIYRIIYSASTSYVDDDYMNEYFGVDGSDAASSGLPFYEADGGIKDFGMGISVDYSFTPVWGVISWFNYYRMIGDAKDSPIVDSEGNRNQLKAGLVLTYSF